MNGIERLLRDIDRPDLIGEGLTVEVGAAIADNYPPAAAARAWPDVTEAEVRARMQDRHAANSTALTEPFTAVAPGARRDLLEIDDVATISARLEAAPPIGYLFRGVWPADAYGVLAAVDKAGKSWMELDAAVSVASGTPWLDVVPVDRAGRVLVFYGEGSERSIMRRLHAICATRGLVLEELPIRLCARVPHLATRAHLDRIAAELADNPAVLVIIDPLYLASRGADTANLVGMGEHLEEAQHVVQDAGGALMVVAHYNKTGTGKGSHRISGVGPGAWGRVLATVTVESRRTEPDTKRTVVVIGLDFIGGEIPDTTIRFRRQVWADNPDDLNSALHYELQVVEDEPPETSDLAGFSPSARRILAILQAHDIPQTVREIGDDLAAEGRPLKVRTIQNGLADLLGADLVDTETEGAGHPGRWWTTDVADLANPA